MQLRRLTPQNCWLLICDIQDHFLPLIYRSSTVVHTCRYLTSVADILDIPMICTQQYTKAFGETAAGCFATPEIRVRAATPQIYEKKKFSMITDEVQERLNTLPQRDSYVVVGIEAHVCLQQTCLDLLRSSTVERPVDVYVVADGVGSQQLYDRAVALQRLVQAGATVTTAQSLVFELMGTADHANFKAISKLTVEHMKLPNEFNDDFSNSVNK